jgi:hypothetical protein
MAIDVKEKKALTSDEKRDNWCAKMERLDAAIAVL